MVRRAGLDLVWLALLHDFVDTSYLTRVNYTTAGKRMSMMLSRYRCNSLFGRKVVGQSDPRMDANYR